MVRKTGYTRIIEGGFWLIRLRWLAVIGILIATAFADRILKISIQQIPLYFIAIVLLLLNLVSLYALKYTTKTKIPIKILKGESIVKFQILTGSDYSNLFIALFGRCRKSVYYLLYFSYDYSKYFTSA